MSKTPLTDAFIENGFSAIHETETLEDFARKLETDRAELVEALKAIESDDALYDTYFRSTATKPMARAEWERRNKWLTDTRALLARLEAE